jgi:hypothetical protein
MAMSRIAAHCERIAHKNPLERPALIKTSLARVEFAAEEANVGRLSSTRSQSPGNEAVL